MEDCRVAKAPRYDIFHGCHFPFFGSGVYPRPYEEKTSFAMELEFSLFGQLKLAVGQGDAQKVLAGSFHEMIPYAIEHLGDEEALLRAHGYPKFETHKAVHDLLRYQLADIQVEFATNPSGVTNRDL